MEQALWNGKEVTAYGISLDYMLEKTIRIASKNEELCCLDPNCKNPILRYCHGDVKEPYFAHKSNSDCIYDEFEKRTPEHIKQYCHKVAAALRVNGYDVSVMVRVADRHIAHLVLNQETKTAVEFITTKIGVDKLDWLKRTYKELGYFLQLIVVTDNTEVQSEKSISFAKRYCLNEGENLSLMMINRQSESIIQVAEDKNDYRYQNLCFNRISQIYKNTCKIEEVSVSGGFITIPGFDEGHKAHCMDNKAKFEEWKKERIKREEEREKQCQREEAEREKQRKQQEEIRQVAKDIEDAFRCIMVGTDDIDYETITELEIENILKKVSFDRCIFFMDSKEYKYFSDMANYKKAFDEVYKAYKKELLQKFDSFTYFCTVCKKRKMRMNMSFKVDMEGKGICKDCERKERASQRSRILESS